MKLVARMLCAMAATVSLTATHGCGAGQPSVRSPVHPGLAANGKLVPEIERYRVELERRTGNHHALRDGDPLLWVARALDAIERQFVDPIDPAELVDVAIDGIPPAEGTRDESNAAIVDASIEAMMNHVDRDGDYLVRDDTSEPPGGALNAREKITIAGATIQHRSGGCATIRIRLFHAETPEEVRSALRELTSNHKVRGLVLDLRGNTGGLLSSAIGVADLFIESGLLAKVVGRGDTAGERFFATGTDYRPAVPSLAVVVNEETAAGAEVLTLALKAHRKARTVGQRTFGRGTVQTLIPVSDTRTLKLTTSRILDPHGSTFEKGIKPDVAIEVEMDSVPKNTADSVIRRAYEVLGCSGATRADGNGAAVVAASSLTKQQTRLGRAGPDPQGLAPRDSGVYTSCVHTGGASCAASAFAISAVTWPSFSRKSEPARR